MIEPTPITAPVPMITPSTVRNDRILCSRMVASASLMPEPNGASGHFSILRASIGSSLAARRAG